MEEHKFGRKSKFETPPLLHHAPKNPSSVPSIFSDKILHPNNDSSPALHLRLLAAAG